MQLWAARLPERKGCRSAANNQGKAEYKGLLQLDFFILNYGDHAVFLIYYLLYFKESA